MPKSRKDVRIEQENHVGMAAGHAAKERVASEILRIGLAGEEAEVDGVVDLGSVEGQKGQVSTSESEMFCVADCLAVLLVVD